MSKFNPREHVRNIKGNDYLDVKYRVQWFREDHPNGAIITNLVEVGGMVAVRAEIYTVEGGLLASGMSTARDQPGQTWTGRVIEKAETSAIGRALAHCGYGTQFMDNDGDDLADSPVEKSRQNAPAQRANQFHDETPADNGKTPQTGANGGNSAQSGVALIHKIKVVKGSKKNWYLADPDDADIWFPARDMFKALGINCDNWTEANVVYELPRTLQASWQLAETAKGLRRSGVALENDDIPF